MTTKKCKRHMPEQIVRILRDADAILNAGQNLAAVFQTLEVSELTFERWRKQYVGMKSEEANNRFKQIVADRPMLKLATFQDAIFLEKIVTDMRSDLRRKNLVYRFFYCS